MRHIDLSGNNMNGQGEAIATLLDGNDKLRSVRLADTDLSSDDVEAIELAADHNHSLQKLDLSNNDFFTKRQDKRLRARLLLNRPSRRAKLKNAANVLHFLVNYKNSRGVPGDLTTRIASFIGAMGPEGTDSLDNIIAIAGRVPNFDRTE
jgi:hypothetical protein